MDISYTKGLFTAVADARPTDDGRYQGVVSLCRDDGTGAEDTLYEVPDLAATHDEAIEDAKLLAQRILGELEF